MPKRIWLIYMKGKGDRRWRLTNEAVYHNGVIAKRQADDLSIDNSVGLTFKAVEFVRV